MRTKRVPLHNIRFLNLLPGQATKHSPGLRPYSQVPINIPELQHTIVFSLVNILPWAADLTPGRHLHPGLQLNQPETPCHLFSTIDPNSECEGFNTNLTHVKGLVKTMLM